MSHHTCANCGKELDDNFCPRCGQKASTHRFSIKHIFAHDVIHAFFHFDKGFLYTAKELLTRPGYSIREYVEGKRVNHFNYITFILLLITANTFIYSSFHLHLAEIFPHTGNNGMEKLQLYMLEHMKVYQFLIIPLNALASYIIFRKAKQNYAEHLVINAYKEAGGLLINTIVLLCAAIVRNHKAQFILFTLPLPILFIYYIKFYTQYFSKDYANKFWLNVRSVVAAQIAPLVMLLLVGLIIYYFINKEIVLEIVNMLANQK